MHVRPQKKWITMSACTFLSCTPAHTRESRQRRAAETPCWAELDTPAPQNRIWKMMLPQPQFTLHPCTVKPACSSASAHFVLLTPLISPQFDGCTLECTTCTHSVWNSVSGGTLVVVSVDRRDFLGLMCKQQLSSGSAFPSLRPSEAHSLLPWRWLTRNGSSMI